MKVEITRITPVYNIFMIFTDIIILQHVLQFDVDKNVDSESENLNFSLYRCDAKTIAIPI